MSLPPNIKNKVFSARVSMQEELTKAKRYDILAVEHVNVCYSVKLYKEDVRMNKEAAMRGLAAANAAKLASGEKVVCLNPQQKFEKKQTRKTAINAKCWDCVGGGADVGSKWSIGNCTMLDCSLYPYRPFQVFFGKPTPAALKAGSDG